MLKDFIDTLEENHDYSDTPMLSVFESGHWDEVLSNRKMLNAFIEVPAISIALEEATGSASPADHIRFVQTHDVSNFELLWDVIQRVDGGPMMNMERLGARVYACLDDQGFEIDKKLDDELDAIFGSECECPACCMERMASDIRSDFSHLSDKTRLNASAALDELASLLRGGYA
jgi:hypothetical protein